MTPWTEIEGRARDKKGGRAELESNLPAVLDRAELEARPDSWFLSAMTRRIFHAGMQHRVIDERWADFERYFWGFDPEKLMLLSEEQLERAMLEPKLIRHWGKLRTIPVNAGVLSDLSRREGGFGRWIAAWPEAELVTLWRDLAKRFQRLGGMSAPRFLRLAGRDTFLLTEEVIQALVLYGVVDEKPTRKADLERVSRQFVDWARESGRPIAHVSRILSIAVTHRQP